jgi:hypothetical protein
MAGIRATILLAFLSLLATPAAAVTTDQVVSLKKAGVSDAVILALIERDHTVFSIAPEQIVALQREGLSEGLIIAMLRSGKEGEEAARAQSEYTNAVVASAMAPGPDILIVGHGPERPNTYHYDGFFTNVNNPYLFPLFAGQFSQSYAPYAYDPAPPGVVPYVGGPRIIPRGQNRARSLCYAQVNSSASRGNPLTYVTECPPVLQPSRRAR